MARRGRQIRVPVIETYNNGGREFTKINLSPFRGRPTKVYKRLVEFALLNGLFNEKEFFEDLIVFGFDKGYISDAFLGAITLKYFFKDMNWTKRKRLKELEEN